MGCSSQGGVCRATKSVLSYPIRDSCVQLIIVSRRRPTFQPSILLVHQRRLVRRSHPRPPDSPLTTVLHPSIPRSSACHAGATFEVVSHTFHPQLDPDVVAAFPFPSPPDTPGSYISTKTDPSTLIYAGRLHAQVLAANMRSMMPVLMAYGYGQDDLELLVEDCVNLVSIWTHRL
jgi:hypothetical protein